MKEGYYIKQQFDASVLSDFECGIAAMDNFIHSDLDKDIQNHHCRLYTLHNREDKIVAMFALSFDALYLDDDSREDMHDYGIGKPQFVSQDAAEEFWSKPHFPAMEISYLAVSSELRGKHIGSELVLAIIEKVQGQSLAGCQFITVDAYCYGGYSAIGFYERCGFTLAEIPVASKRPDAVRMFMPLEY